MLLPFRLLGVWGGRAHQCWRIDFFRAWPWPWPGGRGRGRVAVAGWPWLWPGRWGKWLWPWPWPGDRMAGWPDGWVAGWPGGRMAGWPRGRVAGWPGGRVGGCGWVAVAGWPDGRMAGWPVGRLAGWPGFVGKWRWGGGAYLEVDCNLLTAYFNNVSSSVLLSCMWRKIAWTNLPYMSQSQPETSICVLIPTHMYKLEMHHRIGNNLLNKVPGIWEACDCRHFSNIFYREELKRLKNETLVSSAIWSSSSSSPSSSSYGENIQQSKITHV